MYACLREERQHDTGFHVSCFVLQIEDFFKHHGERHFTVAQRQQHIGVDCVAVQQLRAVLVYQLSVDGCHALCLAHTLLQIRSLVSGECRTAAVAECQVRADYGQGRAAPTVGLVGAYVHEDFAAVGLASQYSPIAKEVSVQPVVIIGDGRTQVKL